MTLVPLYTGQQRHCQCKLRKRVLGVHFSSDLSLDKHVSSVSEICFYHLRQLTRIRRSLDADSASTLVHAFVTSRVDYCNAGAPKTTTDRCYEAVLLSVDLVYCQRRSHTLLVLNPRHSYGSIQSQQLR